MVASMFISGLGGLQDDLGITPTTVKRAIGNNKALREQLITLGGDFKAVADSDTRLYKQASLLITAANIICEDMQAGDRDLGTIVRVLYNRYPEVMGIDCLHPLPESDLGRLALAHTINFLPKSSF
jgi:hypothetical protein